MPQNPLTIITPALETFVAGAPAIPAVPCSFSYLWVTVSISKYYCGVPDTKEHPLCRVWEELPDLQAECFVLSPVPGAAGTWNM